MERLPPDLPDQLETRRPRQVNRQYLTGKANIRLGAYSRHLLADRCPRRDTRMCRQQSLQVYLVRRVNLADRIT